MKNILNKSIASSRMSYKIIPCLILFSSFANAITLSLDNESVVQPTTLGTYGIEYLFSFSGTTQTQDGWIDFPAEKTSISKDIILNGKINDFSAYGGYNGEEDNSLQCSWSGIKPRSQDWQNINTIKIVARKAGYGHPQCVISIPKATESH